jgi:hypothetical protein
VLALTNVDGGINLLIRSIVGLGVCPEILATLFEQEKKTVN